MQQNFLLHLVAECTSSSYFYFPVSLFTPLHAIMCVYMPHSKHKNIKRFGIVSFLSTPNVYICYLLTL
eukprot:UN07731